MYIYVVRLRNGFLHTTGFTTQDCAESVREVYNLAKGNGDVNYSQVYRLHTDNVSDYIYVVSSPNGLFSRAYDTFAEAQEHANAVGAVNGLVCRVHTVHVKSMNEGE